jgi:GNAT superfamily N-acetyltransferase
MQTQEEQDAIIIEMAEWADLTGLLALYRYLNPADPLLPVDNSLQRHWQDILDNKALHYIVARVEGELVSTCNLTIVPNLTRSARPYGLIENVVTHPDYRRRGIGTQVLQYALAIAWQQGCHKAMLLTSSKNEATLRFYEQAGFMRGEKTGFVARPEQDEVACA